MSKSAIIFPNEIYTKKDNSANGYESVVNLTSDQAIENFEKESLSKYSCLSLDSAVIFLNQKYFFMNRFHFVLTKNTDALHLEIK